MKTKKDKHHKYFFCNFFCFQIILDLCSYIGCLAFCVTSLVSLWKRWCWEYYAFYFFTNNKGSEYFLFTLSYFLFHTYQNRLFYYAKS